MLKTSGIMENSIINLVRGTVGDPIPSPSPTNLGQPRWPGTTWDDTPPAYVQPANATPVQIFIRDCNTGKSIRIDVNSLSETIMDVKIKFKDKNHISVEHQRFIFEGKALQDGMNLIDGLTVDKKLSYYDIKDGNTLIHVFRLPGGVREIR
jgi:hypothetical protein